MKKVKLIDLFWEGHNALLEERYLTAIKCFTEIINDKKAKSFQYLSGAYVNLAKATIESSLITNDNETYNFEDNDILNNGIEMLEHALKIKPSNQAACSLLVVYNFMRKDYAKSIDYFLKLKDPDAVKQGLMYLSMLQPLALKGDKYVLNSQPAIEKLYERKRSNITIVSIMANVYIVNKEINKAYFVLRNYIDSLAIKDAVSTIPLYNTLSLLCSSDLNKPAEGEEYALTGIQIIKGLPEKKQKELRNILEYLQSNLVMSYLGQHKYDQSIDTLTSKVKDNPNNTDLHNLAYAYFRKSEYLNSLKFCEKAMLIYVDETTLYITAENYFHLGLYEDALNYYKKAVSFIVDGGPLVEFKDGNNQQIVSNTLNTQVSEKKLYLGLIQCYITIEDYVSAKAVTLLIKNKWEYDDELIRLNRTIDLFLNKQSKENEVTDAIAKLHEELKYQKRKFEKELSEERDWSLKLMKLQNRLMNENEKVDLNEADWRVIMKQMHDIATEMKRSSQDMNNSYEVIRKNFAKKFTTISEEGLSFLSTGEFLYQHHKDDYLDFAPIMVEYSKVVETELNRLFRVKNLISKNESLTLGQLQAKLRKTKISNLPDIHFFLEKIVHHRNGSAHTGLSTRVKVEKIRALLLEEGWLSLILKAYK
jgi:tetratricopeptide (TPR) repeat protein